MAYKLAVGHTNEATSPNVLKQALAEFLAVFLFVFIGVGAVISYNTIHITGERVPDLDAAGLTVIALAHGIAIFVTVAATANISGGHVNPAVTFGLALTGKITVLTGLVYWVAQLAGAVLAALLLGWVLPNSVIPVHTLGLGTTWYAGIIIEFVLTFALVFVIFATAVDGENKTVIAPIAIGFTVLAAHFIAVPFTGASLNPARSFGPALAAWDFTDHWIYWVGPLLGGAVAAILYEEVFLAAEQPAHRHAPPSADYS
eukprot:TRINITY_DN368_c1_g1_i1.p1 TRINITY_DN368_c1_g1~~TRINITY_DN368_c1_g1_i1.p1  ORF type:complete len:258 (+),score=10.42 TRINITY_DN368_c1_g1_i1:71-844(+)